MSKHGDTLKTVDLVCLEELCKGRLLRRNRMDLK